MAEAVIAYDRDLPEIPDRRPWERPASHLVKDDAAPNGWRVDDSGRRPSRLLLPPKIRAAVDAWRDGGYAGASEVTRRLFAYSSSTPTTPGKCGRATATGPGRRRGTSTNPAAGSRRSSA